MVKEFKSLLTVILIEAHMKMVSLMVMANISGAMVVLTKGNLNRVSEMVREFGKNQLIPIRILMKENLLMRKSKVMEFLHGQTVVNTRGIFLTMSDKVTAKCIGAMEIYTRENGIMEFKFNKFHNLST